MSFPLYRRWRDVFLGAGCCRACAVYGSLVKVGEGKPADRIPCQFGNAPKCREKALAALKQVIKKEAA